MASVRPPNGVDGLCHTFVSHPPARVSTVPRPAYLVRRGACYYFRKRISNAADGAPRRSRTHISLSLRTKDRRVAVERMMTAFETVNRFEVHAELAERAAYLVREMRRHAKPKAELTFDDVMRRHLIERLCGKLICDAQAVGHDLVNHPAEFHYLWQAFVKATCEAERSLSFLERRSYERGREEQREAIAAGWSSMTVCSVPDAIVVPQTTGKLPVEDADGGDGSSTEDLPMHELIEMFLAFLRKTDGNEVNVAEARLPLQFLVDLLDGPTVSELTRTRLNELELALPDVPKTKGIPKEYRASLITRYRYAREHGWEGLSRVSKTTLSNRWQRRLHNFFDWAIERGHLEGPRYTFRLKGVENPDPQPRDGWTIEEVVAFFPFPFFSAQGPWHISGPREPFWCRGGDIGPISSSFLPACAHRRSAGSVRIAFSSARACGTLICARPRTGGARRDAHEAIQRPRLGQD